MASACTELSEEALRDHENSRSPAPKAGQPRLDPFNKILYDFYELLVLFEILQRSLGCSRTSHFSNTENDEAISPWRAFLNQLSWLCDFKNGGDSSSSIAVEDTAIGPRYWVAVNFDRQGIVPEHLQEILCILSELEHQPSEEQNVVAAGILLLSLDFSRKKFDNYRRLLLNSIKAARTSMLDPEDYSPEAQLLQRVKHCSKQMDRSELSNFAFDYVKSHTVREIHGKYRDRGPRGSGSAWYNICHYIGRLGAWARAVKVVVYFVRHHPGSVKNSQVKPLITPPPVLPPPADHKTNLDGVVERMLPKDKSRAEKIIEQLRKATAPVFDLDEVFSSHYESKTFQPRLHAEVLLHETFSINDLVFYGEDRFVGGSKPSCYCCDLYFRCHRGAIATRPSHGNVWPKWCLPPGVLQEDERRLDWEGKTVLKRIIKQIRFEILDLVESDLPRRTRVQDSTSGVWTAPTLRVQLT